MSRAGEVRRGVLRAKALIGLIGIGGSSRCASATDLTFSTAKKINARRLSRGEEASDVVTLRSAKEACHSIQ